MNPMYDKGSSMLPAFSVTCRRQGKSRQPSYTQTCESPQSLRPILVTSWTGSGLDGLHGLSAWSEIVNVSPRRASVVDSVLSASLREARAYFRQAHIADYRMWEYANEDMEQDLFHEL